MVTVSGSQLEFGLLLPHFTEHVGRDTILESARRAEGLGFDSVWVRDHLFISPDHREHGGISDPGVITEAMMTLSALSAITSTVKLGTAVITPHRHPLKVAQLFGTLDYLSGGRVILGIGAGWDKREFEAVGFPFDKRLEMVRETVEVCRLAWGNEEFSFEGDVFDIPWGSVNPRPLHDGMPVWYGGLSYKAVELAVELGEGWIPSRMPFDRLQSHIEYGKDLLGTPERIAGFTFAAMPQTAIGASADEALESFNLDKVLQEALHRKPVSGGRTSMSLDDLHGYLIYGNGADICRHVERFVEIDVSHVVFDLRSSFETLWDSLEVLGRDVIPNFRG